MAKPVGYKSPPEHSRWKKGESGNPTGRKKGQRNLKTDLSAELAEIIQVTEGGIPRRLTKQRAVLKALTAKAIGGDAKASGLVLSLVMRLLDPPADNIELPSEADDEALVAAFLARRAKFTGENE